MQSGKYNDLLDHGLDFKALVDAHDTSMELVEVGNANATNESSPRPKQPRTTAEEPNVDTKSSSDQETHTKGSSKLIKDEEREIGQVSLNVYKVYCTEAFGWWGPVLALLLSVLWQGSLMAGDYWLAYETAEERAVSFNPSLFIKIYTIIAAVSCVLITIRAFFVTILGLKTAQIYFTQILHSILHAPMSFFDTTPSGRILSRVGN